MSMCHNGCTASSVDGLPYLIDLPALLVISPLAPTRFMSATKSGPAATLLKPTKPTDMHRQTLATSSELMLTLVLVCAEPDKLIGHTWMVYSGVDQRVRTRAGQGHRDRV